MPATLRIRSGPNVPRYGDGYAACATATTAARRTLDVPIATTTGAITGARYTRQILANEWPTSCHNSYGAPEFDFRRAFWLCRTDCLEFSVDAWLS
ncbi:uncharacterized protein SETTUDRAFT_163429 [Exserohilum turcica Et28A]|uniref:Uncharacterized protein n=1 Tax=Exserohilum turcicum (strain 28A) TaxID=671987 RepID=R0K4N6_EXST2|nr:uncharacterized protein SETTUDRAFT_163429 [Exserohilum turcica Et28A]EOA84499.1 hypothetical protein SETTUDRAFT_163429 [Exserohilum turcica Et28A]